MPSTKGLYAASCNPSRRAKHSRRSTSDVTTVANTESLNDSLPLPILPRPSSSQTVVPVARSTTISNDSTDTTPPFTSTPTSSGKRGRKPGAISRSARETQRKLNHSIIEKARRTKINDALSTLRQLVPSDFGSTSSSVTGRVRPKTADDDDEDGDDADYQEGNTKEKPKGKKEEKEKEFKLEILVRTVAYMQFLIQKVADLENELTNGSNAPPVRQCKSCQRPLSSSSASPNKRKRSSQMTDSDVEADVAEVDIPPPSEHRFRRRKIEHSGHESPRVAAIPSDEIHAHNSPSVLPSIASWLPNIAIDPSLLPPNAAAKGAASRVNPTSKPPISPVLLSSSPRFHTYLPSPPSSTTFAPSTTHQLPPVLSLPSAASMTSPPLATKAPLGNDGARKSAIDSPEGIVRTRTSRSLSVTSSSTTATTARTPEEESAASLLLQIKHSGSGSTASSPAFGPVSSSSRGVSATKPVGSGSSGYFAGTAGHVNDVHVFELGGREERRYANDRPSSSDPIIQEEGKRLVALTPSSMLGLKSKRDD